MEILKVNDIVYNEIVYDEQTIGEMFHSLDLKQLEYLYDVLSMIIDQRVIEGE